MSDLKPTPAGIGRRGLLRKAGLFAAAAAVSPAIVKEASAAVRWCTVDPVVAIDGQLADIYLSSTLKMVLTATGPSVIKVSMPVGSTGVAILNDTGFALKGYKVSFVQDSTLVKTKSHTPLRIDIFVPSDDDTIPVSVTFAPRSLNSSLKEVLFGTSADGYSNDWVTLSV